jgi:hypothetical protein
VSLKLPRCYLCRKDLRKAHLVIDSRWVYPDCAYMLEYGPAQPVTRPPRARLQGERLPLNGAGYREAP